MLMLYINSAVKHFLFYCLFLGHIAYSQNTFSIVGDSYGIDDINSSSCGEVDTCFTLTSNTGYQAGAVWDDTPVNLNYSFDALFCLTLGSNDLNGADGFAFVMRGLASSDLGITGGGLGYEGISPSVAIEYDTYNNGLPKDDIANDHTGIYINSNFVSPLASSVQLSQISANVEDGAYHTTRIVWDAFAMNLEMYFDGVLRVSGQVDLINQVFNGENEVLWGFTASTGGSTNLQQICFPSRGIELDDYTICKGDTVELSYYTDNLTSFTWSDNQGDTLVDWNSIDYASGFDLQDTVIFISSTGTYYLNVSFNNEDYMDSSVIEVISLPQHPFIKDTLVYCPDETDLELDALNPGMLYSWTPFSASSQIIQDNIGYNGYVSVVITDPIYGCNIKDSIYVSLFCEPSLIMPNVFTPNNDGVNDFFEPIYLVEKKWVKPLSYNIFNRWGHVVYSSNVDFRWDGLVNNRVATEGVYFYVLTFTDILDSSETKISGYFHLVK